MTRDEPIPDETDPVEESSRGSFPASDPPGWVVIRTGAPKPALLEPPRALAERVAWNDAIEAVAQLVEASAHKGRQTVVAEIRLLKRPAAE